jgi:hypothetical protein
MQTKHGLFISYAHSDYELVRGLFEALEGCGWKLFWDRIFSEEQKQKPRQTIYGTIESSRCVIVTWTRHSFNSDFVLGEAVLAKRLGTLVEVLLEKVHPPLPFGRSCIDLTDWNGQSGHNEYQRLLNSLKERVNFHSAPSNTRSDNSLAPYSHFDRVDAALPSTAALVGPTPGGPIASPAFVREPSAYREVFEGEAHVLPSPMSLVVRGFFDNGGVDAYVVRVETNGDEDAYASALASIEELRNIDVVVLPGVSWPTRITSADKPHADHNRRIIRRVIDHCQEQRRMALIDLPSGLQLRDEAGVRALDLPRSRYAALYYPWLHSPEGLIPPSGLVAGLWARVDNERGFWKAPAGTIRGTLRGDDIALEFDLSDTQTQTLAKLGINPIICRWENRPMQAPTVFGNRSLAAVTESGPDYLNVCRTQMFFRKNIRMKTEWVVYGENTPELWNRVEDDLTAFLLSLFREGTFTPGHTQECFYVSCGEGKTMTEKDVRDNRVVIEVGYAMFRPREFDSVKIVHQLLRDAV